MQSLLLRLIRRLQLAYSVLLPSLALNHVLQSFVPVECLLQILANERRLLMVLNDYFVVGIGEFVLRHFTPRNRVLTVAKLRHLVSKKQKLLFIKCIRAVKSLK